MLFNKKSLTQWVAHRCERQLGLSLFRDRDQEEDAALGAAGLGIPHRQLRPGLQQMADAGVAWQSEKLGDLLTVFGPVNVLGRQARRPVMNGPDDYASAVYKEVGIDTHLAGAQPGQFLVEAQFDPLTAVFVNEWDLGWRGSIGLEFSEVRPDLIQVCAPGFCATGLTPAGAIVDLTGDERRQLRVIDLKLSSQPGPGYFAEVTYYSLALAAFLEENELDDQFVVAADAALWVGSHDAAAVRTRFAQGGASHDELLAALNEDLLVVPTEVFVSEIARFFRTVLPRVAPIAATYAWRTGLAWHVASSCSGCDYLGQSFPGVDNPGTTSAPHANHCVPTAATIDHLSRLPYLPRGGTTMLNRTGIATTAGLAALDPAAPEFDLHHSLRANRAIIPSRAVALATPGAADIGDGRASTAAIPKWSDLSLYVTADFDPTSAITLAFGLSGFFLPSRFGVGAGQPPIPVRTATYYVEHRTVEAERTQLSVFLHAIEAAMTAASTVDPQATMQVYVWDTLTFEHLTRVIGRHLDWLLATDQISRLAWLFPPDDIVDDPGLTKVPAISVVADAVRGVLATSEAHTYTLLGTAAIYNEGGDFNPAWLNTPPFWTTEFSDQIPGERAFDLWTRRNRPNLPYAALVEMLNRTVRARHAALATVVRRLRDDLRTVLPRTAPKISNVTGPGFQPATSMLGSLLFAHAKLNAAITWQETLQLRAAAPHEREARFASIVCEASLAGDDAATAADELGITLGPNTMIFRISEASTEAKAAVGDFTWAISPEAAQGLLERNLFGPIRDNGLEGEAWWTGKAPWITTFEGALAVTIRGFSRAHRLVAIEFNQPDIVTGLVDNGLVDLNGRCVLDPVSVDFLSRRIKAAGRAIGNPPKAAASDAAIRASLNVTTRGPRTSAACPAEDLLWDAAPLETIEVGRDVDATRALVEDRLAREARHTLNLEQWEAWGHALGRRLSLIWGPPGTGKSRTVGVILDGLLDDAAATGAAPRILLTASTYTAIDNVLQPAVERHADVVTMRRIRSDASQGPQWAVDAGVDVTKNTPAMFDLVAELTAGGAPVVVGTTPQQAQQLIEDTLGSPGGELFDVIIIDEGGQLDVGHALLVLAGASSDAQVIVAGDPLQLPPIHQAEPPDHLATSVGPIYSFFKDGHDVPECVLLTNYRSNAEIVELARYAGYPADYVAHDPTMRLPATDGLVTAPDGWPVALEWDSELSWLADPDMPIVCVTYPEGLAGQWNQFEADLTVGVAAILSERLTAHASTQADGWLWDEGIGIVAPHRAQRSLLVNGLSAAFPAVDPEVFDGAVDTVERFQGQERNAILASYAVGDPDTIAQEEEFLQDLNRFNVLATRAKTKLIVLITDELLSHIASDIEIIRGSRLIKSFADTFCTERRVIPVTHHDPAGVATTIDLTVRWRPTV